MDVFFRRLQGLALLRGADFTAAIRVRQRLVFAAFGLALLWYLVRPAPVALMAAAALAGFILLSYLWARQMAIHLGGQRRLVYTALQVGDEMEEIVTLRNDSLLPVLYVEFRDRSSLPDYTLSSVRAVDGSSTLQWRARAVCTRRGVFTLGPWELITGDPFGIFEVTRTYASRSDMLVYPPLAALPQALLPLGRAQGDERPLHQPTAAESLSASATRPYQPGDPLRRLHWPTTARREQPFIKTFQPEAAARLWLVPDLDTAVQAGGGADSTLETSVTLLASLAERLLKQRLAVGLLCFSGGQQPGAVVLPPQRGQEQFWLLLRQLAGLQPVEGMPFAPLLARARALLSPRDRLLAVTPSLSAEWLAPLQHINGGSQQRAEVILLDPASFNHAPPTGASQSSSGALLLTLAGLGIPAHVLRRGDLQPLSGLYGDLQRWEFTTGGTGRVFVRRAPRAARLSPNAHWSQP